MMQFRRMTHTPATQFAAIAVVTGAITGAWLLTRTERWVGLWNSTVQTLADSVILTGPLVSVLGCTAAIRFRRGGFRTLATSAYRSTYVAIGRELVKVWLPATLGFTPVAVSACTVTAAKATLGPVPILHLLTIPAALAAFAALGFGIGHVIRHIIAPVLALMGSLLLPYQAVIHDRSGWPNLVTSDQLVMTYGHKSTLALALQLLWFSSLVVVISMSMSRPAIRWIAASAATGLAVALLSVGTRAYVPDARARESRCSQGDGRVCVPLVRAFQLTELSGMLDEAVALTSGLHVDGLTLVDEDADGPIAASTVLPFAVLNGNRSGAAVVDRDATLTALGPSLLTIENCELFTVPYSNSDDDVQEPPNLTPSGDLLLWYGRALSLRSDVTSGQLLPADARPGALAQRLQIASAESREAWFTKVRGQIKRCDPELAQGSP